MSPTRAEVALAEALTRRRTLVVCGAGGVGKTTTSACLGLMAALRARRVLVCTIDPSRRLATSLGLDRLADTPQRLALGRLGAAEGEMWAMTLDTKRTFDALVEKHAPDEAARRRILDNPFYKQVSAALAGSHEYMAMEKLLELHADERFDLVVLDTPPTRHALDFLEAPQRMLSFLDSSVLRFFLRPYFAAGRLTLKVATRTGRIALDMVDRFLGLQFLQDLSEFFLAFEDLYDGFKERAGRVQELLRDPASGFVLVTSPARATLEEAVYFHERLTAAEMPFVGIVVNRVHPVARRRRGRPLRGPVATPEPALAERLAAVYREHRALARTERLAIDALAEITEAPLIEVPELDGDVHDLKGLRTVGGLVLGEAPPHGEARA